ncbi:MAG TPA: EAL domain-containing protein [Acidimicrobiales bacterium]|nr:EAL domain-containing protein [Acidimicrobiales bacterium]
MATQDLTVPMPWIRQLLPEGRPLPDEVWRHRHRFILALLWAHAAGLFAFSIVRGNGLVHSASEAGVVAVAAGVATVVGGRRARSAVGALGLVMSSAVLVHLSGGVVEAHFHFFVMVAVLTFYQEWLPFLVAAAFVVLHHGVVGVLDADAVYNHYAAINNPWKWALIHGGFVAAAAVANVTAWRLNEESGLKAERSYQQLQASEARFRGIIETAQEGVWLLDSEGCTSFVNRKGAEMLGVDTGDALGSSFAGFVDPEHGPVVQAKLERWAKGPAQGDELKFRRADGSELWGLVAAAPVVLDDSGSDGILVMLSDITERKAAEEALAHQAFHDKLTGLANRALFLDRLEHALARRARHGVDTAVLFLDLDRFKAVNDSLGHASGDELLVAVAQRLSSVVRPGDTVGRMGGDEFVVLCEELEDERAALNIADRVARTMGAPFVVDGNQISVTASIGIAFASPAAYDTPDALLREADAAMYRAKACGRNGIEVADPEIRARALERLEMEAALRAGIGRGELRVHYQPVVDLATSQVMGCEALVRWERPGFGLVPPMEFIPLAEESGLIVSLGALVLSEACGQVAAWNRQRPGGPPLTASVNVSARQLGSPGLIDVVRSTLSDSGLDPISLCLEITESVLMEDEEATRGALDALKRLGVSVAVDDFGTGYSSLVYLRRFPVDELKVDRSFVSGLGDNAEDSAIVAGVIGLAHALGMAAVAEGVETPEQAEHLKQLGCGLAQGFHWSRPLPAAEFGAWLEDFWASAASAPAGPLTVLLVDDQVTFRRAARTALELEGCFDVVAEAGDGAEAIRLAELHQPDLVLLDLVMPGMGGLEALPHILEVAPATKVAFLTALQSDAVGPKAVVNAAGCFEKSDLGGAVRQLAALLSPGGPKAQCYPISPLATLSSISTPERTR